MPAMPALLELRDLAKHYGAEPVFSQVQLSVAPGEFIALLGESGVGKSTLLNCIAGLDTVSAGSVRFNGDEVTRLDDPALARLRRTRLGFIFQAFHVLPHLSVAQNVALPLLLNRAEDPARVDTLLQAVGLAGMAARAPETLSGGQLQRVAIARALVHSPQLILADEPTGNLDPATAQRVLQVLVEQVRSQGAACLLVTHAEAAARVADRVLRLTPTGLQVA
jgi:putative ABC transport system ATP-binding protein